MVAKYSDISDKGLVINAQAVESSLDNIMRLSPFDVFFNPVGAALEHLLFRPMNSQTEAQIFYILSSAVADIDDRIIIDNTTSKVVADYDDQSYKITLRYRILGLGEALYTYSRNIKVKFKELL